jgi:hypothetical protein
MLSSKITNLVGLSIDEVSSMVDMFINESLVLDIDEWPEEGDGSGNKRKAPKWKPLDKPISKERTEESLVFVRWFLSGRMCNLQQVLPKGSQRKLFAGFQ